MLLAQYIEAWFRSRSHATIICKSWSELKNVLNIIEAFTPYKIGFDRTACSDDDHGDFYSVYCDVYDKIHISSRTEPYGKCITLSEILEQCLDARGLSVPEDTQDTLDFLDLSAMYIA